jgi:hypothetical protein
MAFIAVRFVDKKPLVRGGYGFPFFPLPIDNPHFALQSFSGGGHF